ncbi:TPA: fimbrial protein [Stenotrophomonas maltophilia]
MNKLAIALTAALSLGAAASASAADATINFSGEIKALTCTISAGASGTSVTMPTLSAAVINGGTGARQQDFTIQMGASGGSCDAGTYILSFNGANLEEGRLKKTTGTADNVELAILEGGTEVDLRTHTITRDLATAGSISIPLVAKYEKAAAGDASNGTFNTGLEVFVQY